MKTNVFLFLLSFLGISQFSYAQIQEDSIDKTYEFFEISQQPSFPGGADAMRNFISSNLNYPIEAQDNGIEGRVAIQFVVDTDGSIVNINISRDPGGGLGEEGARVVRLMPKWSPGYQKDVPVRIKMVIPFNFKLNRDSIKKKGVSHY